MSFILSANRKTPEDVVQGFAAYKRYLTSLQDRFPPSALRLAMSDWYFTNSRKSPHDSWLEEFQMIEAVDEDSKESRVTSVRVRLLGSYHDGFIELRYPKVFGFSISGKFQPDTCASISHGDWLWDEFTVSENNRLVHEIEWGQGAWRVVANDVHYSWHERSE